MGFRYLLLSLALIFIVSSMSLAQGVTQSVAVRIRTDVDHAKIFSDDRELAVLNGKETLIEMPLGYHKIRVEKLDQAGNWVYKGESYVMARGAKAVDVEIKTKKFPTKARVDALLSKMKFSYIKPGSFLMGSPEFENDRNTDEIQHKVIINRGFYLQTTEVTQEQWMSVMDSNPSSFQDCGNNCPVENVSWNDAQEFIYRLNEVIGKNRYRLPTEAEWEYACRAETVLPFFFGECLTMELANFDVHYKMTECKRKVLEERTAKTLPVASFPPNDWGLYDMHGNVYEWCQDWYGDYPTEPETDPTGPVWGMYRVFRGGSWYSAPSFCRSAKRDQNLPTYRSAGHGFRLVQMP